jgi:phage terminase large subunit-like protein
VTWPGGGDIRTRLDAVLAREIEQRKTEKRWRALPHQVPPPGEWLGWLLMAGRGAGKTEACAKYVVDHVNGPPCIDGPVPHWMAIVAPTLGDAATACYSGPSGIRSFDPGATMSSKVGGLLVTWPNGSQAKMYGARDPDDVERLRAGGNTCLAWLEELAAWRYLQDAFDQLRFGLRIGTHPRWVASTTPKPRPLIKQLYKNQIRGVTVTHATMYDNPHLPTHIKDALEEAYSGSSLGTQELYGRLVEQDTNALWTRDTLERTRLVVAPPLRAVEVGVDPSGGAGEQGIVVVGRADEVIDPQKNRILKHGYVLADATVHMKPEGWARTAVTTAIDWEADRLVVETNFGGDQAVALLVNACEKLGVSVPIRTVHASRGKQPRAQPVSAMSAQDRWHLVGHFDELEDQLCTWTIDSDWSPDRIDAMVWPAWSMKLVSTIFRAVGSFGGSQMAGRVLGRRRAQ